MPIQNFHSINPARVTTPIEPSQDALSSTVNSLLSNISNISRSQENTPTTPTHINLDGETNELTPEKYSSILKSWAKSAPSPEMQKIRQEMSDTLLNCLKNKLKSLYIDNSPLDFLPLLPPHLENITLFDVGLTEIHSLPSELKHLNCINTKLTKLPDLPAKLISINLANCPITKLPPLPEGLASLACIDTLITQLPECPESLLHINVISNRLNTLPDDLINTPNKWICAIDNPLSEKTINRIENLNGQGATVKYTNKGAHVTAKTHSLIAPIARFFPKHQPSGDIKKDLALIPLDENTEAFIKFLNRLEKTHFVTNTPEIKTQIAQWIEQLSHSSQLQEKTFALAFDATRSCEDRVTLTWNAMKKAALLQDVEQGNYDDKLPDLIKVAREMFRLEKLETISREKARTLKHVDEIEVYLAYQTELHEDLQFSSTAPSMRFFGVAGVDQHDLRVASLITKTAENTEFPTWLAQWEPFKKIIERTAPELWESAEIDLDVYQQRLNNEIDKFSGENNTVMQNDSDILRIIGQHVYEEMKKEAYEPLVDQYFSNHHQSELLAPKWQL